MTLFGKLTRFRELCLLAIIALAAFVSGCGGDSVPSTAATPSASGDSASAPDSTEVTLVAADEKDLAALIEKNKGKFVFVDFWATWCGPCVKGFPHTVEMHKKFQKDGLVVISLNMDLLKDKAKVIAFLKKQGATFDNLISKYDGGGTDANDAFEIGPLPHLRLYDRQGKVRYKWDGPAPDLEAKIKDLLAEKV